MTNLSTKTLNGRKYKYLRYTYREGGKIKYIEQGVTKLIQEEKLTEALDLFYVKVFNIRWRSDVELIKENYTKNLDAYDPANKDNFFEDFGIRFTHNTNKIEGSTLSFKDTKSIILLDRTPNNKPTGDVVEAKSHMNLYREILEMNEPLTLKLITNWHRRLF
ncbi:MAG: hypothetical protein ACTSUE_23785, partial [Promethearchaeota archaeon]